MRPVLLVASALLALPALAQTPGSCEVGTAQAFLDVSDVQASLFTNGSLFFGGSTTSGDGYLVPKASGNSPIFAAALWIGGRVNGEVRTSHSRYGNRQMWPGPLNADGTLPTPQDCSAYDRVWVVSTYDVAIYEETGAASSDLAEWPVGLGAPAVDADGDPVVATSRTQTLELADGERPVISGTQTAFWVMNDVGNEHLERNDARETVAVPALGVEVAVTAFAVVSEEAALHQGTFYRYTVVNRSGSPITDGYVGFYVDTDLGDAGDDYVGVDTTRGLAFVYNSRNEDSRYGVPPAAGFDLLDGLGAFPLTGDYPWGFANTATEVYSKLQGLWNDGTPMTEFGYGYRTSGPTTRFGYPGDPVTGDFWSELDTDGTGTHSAYGDRQLEITSPRFDLQHGASRSFGLAVLFAQGSSNLDSITELRAVSDRVQAAYDDGSLFRATEPTALLGTPALRAPSDASTFIEEQVVLSWDPVPDAEAYRVEQSASPSFEDPLAWLVDSTSTWGALGVNDTTTYHWRVRAESPTRRSAFSDVRSYTSYLYRYVPGVLRLEDGSPAYVEVAAAGGADPCAETAQSRDGCAEVAGNLVYRSFDSTGAFYLSEQGTGSEPNMGAYAPNDFEIRFTEGGSLAAYMFQPPYSVIRVPFEVWDIGPVAPGEANDPADDVRLIPYLFADNGGTCAFNAAEIPEGEATTAGYVESDRIYAYYPVTTYADFAALFEDAVAADGCVENEEQSDVFFGAGSRPIQRQVFGSSSDAPTLPATGTVIRLYTTDPRPVADETTPRAGDLRLGAAYPNPTASSLTVPYTLASPGAVELAVVDVLGRRVLELTTARQLEGSHTATFDASAWAPGVYVVRLRAGEETHAARITVVR